ncbi:hypothetical protein DL93DRAFT_2097772 [Clavulina sp. PMI_390]|nr:hypothetical protein DL93DRAFT_2097772 [Clavulina sp. PMI_390]
MEQAGAWATWPVQSSVTKSCKNTMLIPLAWDLTLMKGAAICIAVIGGVLAACLDNPVLLSEGWGEVKKRCTTIGFLQFCKYGGMNHGYYGVLRNGGEANSSVKRTVIKNGNVQAQLLELSGASGTGFLFGTQAPARR